MRLILLTLFGVSLISGCNIYRMPEADEVSTIPATNNPSVTHQPDEAWTPGLKY